MPLACSFTSSRPARVQEPHWRRISMATYDQDDLNNATLCVWKEARGDGPLAMTAVAHVIFNRVGAPGFADTLHDVIYGKNQFSSMSISTDPEYNLAAPEPTDPEYPSYCTAMNIVNAHRRGHRERPDRWRALLCEPRGMHQWMVLPSHRERSRESSAACHARASGVLRIRSRRESARRTYQGRSEAAGNVIAPLFCNC